MIKKITKYKILKSCIFSDSNLYFKKILQWLVIAIYTKSKFRCVPCAKCQKRMPENAFIPTVVDAIQKMCLNDYLSKDPLYIFIFFLNLINVWNLLSWLVIAMSKNIWKTGLLLIYIPTNFSIYYKRGMYIVDGTLKYYFGKLVLFKSSKRT